MNKRDSWNSPIEFFFSCVALSVGLGNVWRFPYVVYKNGGGAFLIPYFIVLILIGRPIYFLELVIGQFSQSNGIKVWDAVPVLRGVGFGQAISAISIVSYYSILIVIAFYYFISSFQSVLPWSQCRDSFDPSGTEICIPSGYSTKEIKEHLYNLGINASRYKVVGSAEKYFLENVLHIDDKFTYGIGAPNVKILGILIIIYVLMYLILYEGVRSAGKISYFTALFPYAILFIFCVKGLLLENAWEGVKFFLKPDWAKLAQPNVWYTAVGQMFFSLSISTSVIPSMASFNSFKHNIYRDAWILALTDCLTSFIAGIAIFSVLGNLSHELGKPINEVVQSGVYLAFITYPTAISKFEIIPQFFSVLFFSMLMILGFGSLIGLLNGLLTLLSDMFPQMKKTSLMAILAFVSFLLGIIYTTPGGQPILTVVDYYGSVLNSYIFGVLQAMGWGFLYGVNNIKRDVEFMLNIKLGIYWTFTWGITCPMFLLVVMIYQLVAWREITFHGPLPTGILWIGRFIPVLSSVVFFGWVLRTLIDSKTPSDLILPLESWGPKSPALKKRYKEFVQRYNIPEGSSSSYEAYEFKA